MVKTVYEKEQSAFSLVLFLTRWPRLMWARSAEDERKLLCQLLPKLYIPDEIDDLKVKGLLTLITSLKLVRPSSFFASQERADGFLDRRIARSQMPCRRTPSCGSKRLSTRRLGRGCTR